MSPQQAERGECDDKITDGPEADNQNGMRLSMVSFGEQNCSDSIENHISHFHQKFCGG